MRKLIAFILISADGYFERTNHAIDWHHVGPEFNDFATKQLDEADMLVFGRKTYDLMASFWPTDAVKKNDPEVAGRMNDMSKIVFSKTLDKADWENTIVMQTADVDQIHELKQREGKAMLIMGSANLCVSLLELGLLDEIRLMVNPVVLGGGNAVFAGLKNSIELDLLSEKTFQSGNVLLCYAPKRHTN